MWARWDSNPHALAGIRFLVWQVYQFHHSPQNPFYTEREKRGGFSVPKQSTVGLTCYHECFCFVLCAYFNVSSQSSIFFLIAIPDGIQTNITHINPQGDGKKYAERNDNTIAIISMPNIIQKNLDFHHLTQFAICIYFKK